MYVASMTANITTNNMLGTVHGPADLPGRNIIS
jgi:hypothetical protein